MTADETVVDCATTDTRDVNRQLRALIAGGRKATVVNPGARHNIGVALLERGHISVQGSAGYYCAGMNDGATVEIAGSAGWGLAEGMLSGTVVVAGNAGNAAAASIRGGTVVVRGDCAARAAVNMKGGMLLVGGDVGYMSAFMMQRGVLVICGNAGEALADSMYEGVVYVGGEIASLGNDTVVSDATDEERTSIHAALDRYRIPRPKTLRKIVAGRKLWNFEKHELATWREAL